MTELAFILVLGILAAFMAMRRAPLWLWAIVAVAATFLWQTDFLLEGGFRWPAFTGLEIAAWIPAALLAVLALPPLRRLVQ